MNPIQAINSVFGHYFDFKGRAMRSEFWWFVLFYILITVIIALVLVQTSDRAMSVSIGLFFLVLYWWAMPGDPGPNRYGPPPTAT